MNKKESKNRSGSALQPIAVVTASGQLPLPLPEVRTAAIVKLTVVASTKRREPDRADEASKRLLDFAATLPDW